MHAKIICLTLAALAVSGAAQAQPGRGAATLYELPNFQGRSITVTGPAPDLGDWKFNDRAQSARFGGSWRICEHDDLEGRCQDVRGDVPDLTTYGLSGQISSLAPAGFRGPREGRGEGGWGGGGRDQRGIDGTRTVFFPRPTVRGLDLAAARSSAEQFCARQGLGRSVWYDTSERARESLGPDGGMVRGSAVIRDLLCAKP